MGYRDEFRAILAERGITRLQHFTPLDNLASIVSTGIRPRLQLVRDGTPFLASDTLRRDGCLGAISLSITDANWPMLDVVVQRFPDRHWIILDIDPLVLLRAQCRFCASNAASNTYAKSRRQFSSPRDLESMFEDRVFAGISQRARRGLSDAQPTDPQAEILYFGTIQPHSIIGAAAETFEVGAIVQSELDRIGEWERDVDIFAEGN